MSADSDESLRRDLAGESFSRGTRFNSRLYQSSIPDSPSAPPVPDSPFADPHPDHDDEDRGSPLGYHVPAFQQERRQEEAVEAEPMEPELSMATTASHMNDDDGLLITPAPSQSHSQTLPPIIDNAKEGSDSDNSEHHLSPGSSSGRRPPCRPRRSSCRPLESPPPTEEGPSPMPVLPDGVDPWHVWFDPFICRALLSTHHTDLPLGRDQLCTLQGWLSRQDPSLGAIRDVWKDQIPTLSFDLRERFGPLSAARSDGTVIVHLALHRVRQDEEDLLECGPEVMARSHRDRISIHRGTALYEYRMSRDPPPYLRLFPCFCKPASGKLRLASDYFSPDTQIKLVDFANCPNASSYLVPGPSLLPPSPSRSTSQPKLPHRFFRMTNNGGSTSSTDPDTADGDGSDADSGTGIEPGSYQRHAFPFIDEWKWTRRYPPPSDRPTTPAPMPPPGYDEDLPSFTDALATRSTIRSGSLLSPSGHRSGGHSLSNMSVSEGMTSQLTPRERAVIAIATAERRSRRRSASESDAVHLPDDQSPVTARSQPISPPPPALEYQPEQYGIAILDQRDIPWRAPPRRNEPRRDRRPTHGGRRGRSGTIDALADRLDRLDLDP